METESENKAIAELEPYAVRFKTFQESPGAMDRIFLHIANGGDLISFCKNLDLRYSDVAYWIQGDIKRLESYTKAAQLSDEWIRNRILNELACIALYDPRDILDAKGALKPPAEWPEAVARAVSSIEIDEIKEYDPDEHRQVVIGETKKVRLMDKIKALENIGKQFGMFVQKHNVKVEATLEQLVAGSWDADKKP